MKSISFVVIDDHPIFRKGLIALIESLPGYTSVGESDNAPEAFEMILELRPKIVIIDLTLKDSNGLELVKNLKARWQDVQILVVSMHDELYYAERVLAAGARGYVMKQEAATKVLEAIQTVLSGKVFVSAAVKERVLESLTGKKDDLSRDPIEKLSDREFEVFHLIGRGLGTSEISQNLKLSIKTVETHKEHLKVKLQRANSQDLRQYAVEWLLANGTRARGTDANALET